MRRLLIALPALALLAGCGMLYAELEVPSTTITLKSQNFDATASGPLVKQIAFDIGTQLPVTTGKDITYELRLTQLLVDITTGSAMGNFGDIGSVTLSILPPAGQTLPEKAVIASYTKAPPPADQNPKSIAVSGMTNLDLAPYIAAGVMTLELKAVSISGGAIPAWTADVTGEFYLKVNAAYGNLLTKK